ncbi:hypothetical protein DFH09DRAFT_1096993 [Mycena vulgaris]|nr:hypothetical protein DFH09DRAFT_1096993 [Mycena vulgaris]
MPESQVEYGIMAKWYLVNRVLKTGPVHVAVRGENLVLTAGHHALVVHFDLEGNLRFMKRVDFDNMVSTCVPGNNKNRSKANRLHSFLLPSKFLEPGARKKKVHKINILVAIVMDKDVIIITDFSRMSQLHIVSSRSILQSSDIRPGSQLWNTRLWARFKGGPHWIVEKDAALQHLDSWRTDVLRNGTATPIIDVLLDLKGPAAGVGQHLANDLLYSIALHPDTPSLTLCSNDQLYQEFRDYIPIFMAIWTSKEYLHRCAGRPNSHNPFMFREVSHRNFMASYVLVYRWLEVWMPARLYDLYQFRGLFGPTHTVGTPYHGAWTPCTRQWKEVKVCMFKGSKNNWYHVIHAAPPANWNVQTEEIEFKDVTNAGFATTLGPASFFEPMQNKLDIKQINLLIHLGQPRNARTGMSGRPCKGPMRESIARIMQVPKSRFRTQANSVRGVNKENEGEEVARYRTRSQTKLL